MSQHGCPERLSNRSKGFQEDGANTTMEVFVETLTGTAFEMTVSPSDTIFAIKSKICRVEGIPVAQQHLVYNLREVEDGMSLGALGIGAGARLKLVLALRGGPVCTRRLPPPPARLQRLGRNNGEDEWGCGSGACKVTVLVFRDGERVSVLRVRENRDGSYTPLERAKYSSPPPSSSSSSAGGDYYDGAQSGAENAVTLGKMAELRARMRSLSLRRGGPLQEDPPEDTEDPAPSDFQKTRSEETLLFPRLFDECPLACPEDCPCEVECEPLCDCATHAYTVLPPIGTRTDSEQSVQDDEFQLSEALGPVLVGRELDEAAILGQLGRDSIVDHTIPAAEYGPLVGGAGPSWRRARGFGSHSQLSAHAGHVPAHAHSASSLHARAARPPAPAPPPAPLSDAVFSASTSDLERLTRNRLLPALSRHRNREHLHLSDERLDAAPAWTPRRSTPIHRIAEGDPRGRPDEDGKPASGEGSAAPEPPPRPAWTLRRAPIHGIAEGEAMGRPEGRDGKVDELSPETPKPAKEKKLRMRCGWCRKRLSIATVHTCRCGAEFCAPHRYAEVHGCLYDYKGLAREPLPAATKLPRI